MYPTTQIKRTFILLSELIKQTALFIHRAFHLKFLYGNAVCLSINAFSSKFFQASSIVIFNGRSSNHQKLLKISLSVLIWLIIHKCNIGTQHLMALFPCILQWLSDSMVSSKITAERWIRSCLYFMKAFVVASKLMASILCGNRTKTNMVKATSFYCSSPNLPSLAFFFILALMILHLNPSSATLHWLIFPKCNKLTIFEVVSFNMTGYLLNLPCHLSYIVMEQGIIKD